MKTCKNCNEANQEGSSFCIHCGLSLSDNTTVKCPNGHIYDAILSRCPYCPSQDLQTAVGFGAATIQSNRSYQNSEELDKTSVIHSQDKQVKQNNPKDNKTIIVGAEFEGEIKSGRKLVGWLVTFTWDNNGTDYKLFEGRNVISGSHSHDIYIDDSAISSPHCMILYRNEEFKIKDELSTNGTIINGEMVEQASLKDGDIITLGSTILKFKVL